MLKPLTVWITTNWKILRWEYQITWPVCWETCIQVRKQQLELDMVQRTGSKLGKESLCFFNLYVEYSMWIARLDESQAGIKIAGRSIRNLRYADDTTLMAESEEELKSLLMRVKEESEKAGLEFNTLNLLKTQHSKNQNDDIPWCRSIRQSVSSVA